jgi:DNA-directed RNA polymerase subunit RPC12/RpoP
MITCQRCGKTIDATRQQAIALGWVAWSVDHGPWHYLCLECAQEHRGYTITTDGV